MKFIEECVMYTEQLILDKDVAKYDTHKFTTTSLGKKKQSMECKFIDSQVIPKVLGAVVSKTIC